MEECRFGYDMDPDRYLYPPEQNDAMQFAEWDRQRHALEVRGVKLLKFSQAPGDQPAAAAARHGA